MHNEALHRVIKSVAQTYIMLGAKKRLRITVSLTGSDYTRLAGLAERYDVSLSWLARQAITEYLDRAASRDVQLPLVLMSDLRKQDG